MPGQGIVAGAEHAITGALSGEKAIPKGLPSPPLISGTK
jgi:hypothetical protein